MAAERAKKLERKTRPTPALEARAGRGLPDPDPVIHERLRLRILSTLAVQPNLTFNDLKGILDATDGNLSVHARRLEEAGYLDCTKEFAGRVPRTRYRITPAGRRALERYLEQMENLIRAARGTG
ncbi:MAG TPA: transcriptional regulator [Candidatus Eisenbacteria bacterium]